MATGIVRFYNHAKGFGLITPDVTGPALFAHAEDITSRVKKLMPRQRVEFDVREAAAGNSAINIRTIG